MAGFYSAAVARNCSAVDSSLKASKFSEAQIAFVLKQAEDGTAVAEVCRKAGISEATFYIYGRLSRCKRFE